jgi:hypothetical protein
MRLRQLLVLAGRDIALARRADADQLEEGIIGTQNPDSAPATWARGVVRSWCRVDDRQRFIGSLQGVRYPACTHTLRQLLKLRGISDAYGNRFMCHNGYPS